MSAPRLVRALAEAGIRIRVVGGNLVLSGYGTPSTRVVEDIRSAKAEVIAYVRALALWAEEDWNAFYDERAGIMEFDGGLPRAEAEARAAEEVEPLRMVAGSGHG